MTFNLSIITIIIIIILTRIMIIIQTNVLKFFSLLIILALNDNERD